MRLMKQPTRWTCLPTSFAMVLGIDVDTIISEIGHDGSEIVFPDLKEPLMRQGFHIQELIDVAWARFHHVIPFEIAPIIQNGNYHRLVEIKNGNHQRLVKALEFYSGVLTGLSMNDTSHAVAWDHHSHMIYNPVGEIQELKTFRFDTFWLVTR